MLPPLKQDTRSVRTNLPDPKETLPRPQRNVSISPPEVAEALAEVSPNVCLKNTHPLPILLVTGVWPLLSSDWTFRVLY